MSGSERGSRLTRRGFLSTTARAALGLAALGLGGLPAAPLARAAPKRERVKILAADIVHNSAAAFARGIAKSRNSRR